MINCLTKWCWLCIEYTINMSIKGRTVFPLTQQTLTSLRVCLLNLLVNFLIMAKAAGNAASGKWLAVCSLETGVGCHSQQWQ